MPAAGADFVGVISTSPQAKIFELGKKFSNYPPPCFLKKAVGRGAAPGGDYYEMQSTDAHKKIQMLTNTRRCSHVGLPHGGLQLRVSDFWRPHLRVGWIMGGADSLQFEPRR